MFKFKREKIYILKKKTNLNELGFIKQAMNARTFMYRGHKLNLQGDSKSMYAISDNKTGMLLGIYFNKLSEIENKENIEKLDYFIDNIDSLQETPLKWFNEAEVEECE